MTAGHVIVYKAMATYLERFLQKLFFISSFLYKRARSMDGIVQTIIPIKAYRGSISYKTSENSKYRSAPAESKR